MMPKTRSVMVAILGGLLAVAVLWIVSPLSIREMASDSMMPLIRGQGSPPSRSGDYLLLLTAPRLFTPKEGDLVLVEIPTRDGVVETVRRIKSIERCELSRYTVESLDPNGIDSRQFGSLGSEKLKAKVLHVFKR
ncbi:MAG: hypothetical protein BWY50_02146 [Spirochaetes bacterium ADurb.Bin315]|jgi:hypothetical protein|nr:MAG: hypothetical protein BWY50_02146 [Spirochaetes bacterium ADurb.Bin315]